jgi:glutathionylspermidine synthase
MLYGRFDFAYGHDGVPKLLEYNADTPTAILETAVQWHWCQDVYGDSGDQWNGVHEALVARWREMAEGDRLPGNYIHFLHTTSEVSGEDLMTVGYLAETARQAGIDSKLLPIERLGWTDGQGFSDAEGNSVRTAFKLYPWEWMVREDFARRCMDRMGTERGDTLWIEPIWKMMWSNKGILPVLWELFPDHPNLLPAFFEEDLEGDPPMPAYVRKPLLAREGANAEVIFDGVVAERGPDQNYGDEGFVVQQYTDLGNHGTEELPARPVLGVWTVDMEPVGCGIREQTGLITDNTSRFVPNVIV